MVVALVIKSITGYEIPEEVLGQYADAIAVLVAGGISVYGVYKDYRKKAKIVK